MRNFSRTLALTSSLAALPMLVLSSPGFAASDDQWTPPKPTDTTKTCTGKRVWDEEKGRCVRPKQSSLNQDGLLEAARELAYAGRPTDAQAVLSAMTDQQDGRVLTYWGFTHRKLGNQALAQAFYDQAIAQDPDNLLARSYMGQGYVETGQYGLALAQWKEIRARDGAGTWAEASLRKALETGTTSSY